MVEEDNKRIFGSLGDVVSGAFVCYGMEIGRESFVIRVLE